jgi:hypothetical protein
VNAPDAALAKVPEGYTAQTNVRVHHVRLNSVTLRGNSIMRTTMEWELNHWLFMQARVAFEMAVSEFAAKREIKGGPDAVKAAILAMRAGSTGADNVTGTDTTATLPGPPGAPGSTRIENLGDKYSKLPYATGAGDADIDGKMILMMALLGWGLPPSYVGSGDSAGLMETTKMELPVLRQFEFHQGLWRDTYKTICEYALGLMGVADAKVVVTPALIVNRDTPNIIDGITKMFIQEPSLTQVDAVLVYALTLLGVKDAEKAVAELRTKPVIPKATAQGGNPWLAGEKPGEKPATPPALEESLALTVYGLRKLRDLVEEAA